MNIKNKNGDSALYLAGLYQSQFFFFLFKLIIMYLARSGFHECVKLLKSKGNKFTEQQDSKMISFREVEGEIYPRIVKTTVDKLIQQLCYPNYTGTSNERKANHHY